MPYGSKEDTPYVPRLKPSFVPEEGSSVDPPTPSTPPSSPIRKFPLPQPEAGDREKETSEEKPAVNPKFKELDNAMKELEESVKDINVQDPHSYKMNHPKRGLFLLFNVVNFGNEKMKREGTDEDAELIVKTFNQLEFEVVRFNDPTKLEMVELVKEGRSTSSIIYFCLTPYIQM